MKIPTRPGLLGYLKYLALAGLVALGACGGGDETAEMPASTVRTIEVTPVSSTIALGTSTALTATAIYTDNSKRDLTAQVTWTSSDATVATVGASPGTVLGVAPGTTTVSASLHGLSGSATVTVTSAKVTSISITPGISSMAIGTSAQLIATGTFTDNTTQNMAADVRWTSSAPTVATVDASGEVSSLAAGQTTISAICQPANTCGNISATTTITVSTATLLSIGVTPSSPDIALGTTQQFTATGTYSDNSTQDLGRQVTWASSNSAIATIGNTGVTRGLAAALAAGSTGITATMGSVTSPEVKLNVAAATLASIAVTPANRTIAIGTKQSFVATGTYSDNTTQDLSALVTWATSAGSVATIDNAAGNRGLATALAVGSTDITATMGSVTSAAVRMDVAAMGLVSITVTPANQNLRIGKELLFTATGTYSDNSTQDLSRDVTWASSAPAVAAISNDKSDRPVKDFDKGQPSVERMTGRATSLAAGTTGITATMGSIVSAAVSLTVTPNPDSIVVTPATATVTLGAAQQFVATGVFGNTTMVITDQVTWLINGRGVASISNAVGTAGLVSTSTAGRVGSAEIIATYGSITSPAATLNVVAP